MMRMGCVKRSALIFLLLLVASGVAFAETPPTVIVIVKYTLYPEIVTEIGRLLTDLENDGYVAKLETRTYYTRFNTAEELRGFLDAEYNTAGQRLVGALFLGSLPYGTSGSQTTDYYYWQIESEGVRTRRIWVSRLGRSQPEAVRMLQTNHDYRTGAHRLPYTAYYIMHAYPESEPYYYPRDCENALDVWPQVEKAEHPLVPAWAAGGEVLDETMHGGAFGGCVSILQGHPCQVRVNLVTSCGAAGKAKELITTRSTGCIFSVGASATTYTGAFVMMQDGNPDSGFRACLAAGDSWGEALVKYHAFTDTYRAMYYGDLSLRAMQAPANDVPVLGEFTVSTTLGNAPLTVDFGVTASDPDGEIVLHEWFLEGYNKGTVDPAYSNSSLSQSHTYAAAHRYRPEVLVFDNYKACAWSEYQTIVVCPEPGKPLRINCGTYLYNTYGPGADVTDSIGKLWLHDQSYLSDGTWGSEGVRRGGSIYQGNVAGTDNDEVYSVYRYMRADEPVTYRIPVANGTYRVKLGFAEPLKDTSVSVGDRLTDVSVEGSSWLTAYDILAQAGAVRTAVDAETVVDVTDGELTIDITRSAGSILDGLVNAVEMTPSGGGNQFPTCAITSPANGATYTAPATVSISAAASDADGSVAKVEFYQGGTKLGEDTTSPYSDTWSGVVAGTYSLTAKATDNDGATTTSAAVSITVNDAANTPPTVANITNRTVDEDTSTGAISFTIGDAETAADELTLSGTSSNTTLVPSGNIVFGGSGSNRTVTVTSAANGNGSATITIVVTDGGGLTAEDSFVLTVTAVNDAPVAVNDSAATSEDVAVMIDVLGNDGDGDGDELSVTSVTNPPNGTAVNNGSDVTYTPDTGYNGTDTFSYTVSDGNGGTDTATVSVTVAEVNHAPVAADDSATTDEDMAVTIDVLANDTDGDGNVLVVASVIQGANGTVTNNGGDVTYTPNANWNGTDSFTYTVTDGRGGQDTATVTVTVNAVNDAPVAEDVAASTATDTAVDITLGASDVESDPLTHVIDTAPTDGTLSDLDEAAGTVTYTPDAGFEGTDTFTYYANDGEYDSGFSTVSISVTSGSDFVCTIRVSGGDYSSLSAWEAAIESDLTLPASMIFGVSNTGSYDSATDDGGTVAFTGGGTGTLKHVTVAGRAYVTDCVGTIEAGSVTCDASGSTFTVSDTGRQIGSAIAECHNDWPNGLDDLLSISGWTTDLESWVIVRTPAGERHNGTLGNYGNYTGFTMAPTTNDTAIYTNQRYTRIEGIAVDWSQASGEWADGIYLRSSKGQDNADWIVDSCIVANIGHGFSGPAYAVSSPGTFVNCLAYNIAKEGFCSSSFTYARFLNCTAVQCKYGFTAHSYSRSKPEWINCLAYNNTNQDFYGPSTGNPTADYCASGDDSADDQGGDGNRISRIFTFVDESNNDFHLAADDTGAKDYGQNLSADSGYSFTTDIDGDTRTGAWDIGMDETAGGQPPENNPPVAQDDASGTNEDVAVTIDVLGNDSDPDGDALSVASVTDPPHGTAVNNGTDVTYTPDGGYSGSDSFSYTVSDGNGGTDTASVTVTVSDVNHPPVAQPQSVSVDEDGSVAITLGATDADGDGLTYSVVTNPSQGTLAGSGASRTYTPAANYNGSDSFTFRANDGQVDSNVATVSIAVNAVNDAPSVGATADPTSGDVPLTVQFTATGSDVDGDTLSYAWVFGDNGSSNVQNPSHVYAGAGTYTATVTVSDGKGGTASDSVVITIDEAANIPPVAVASADVTSGAAPLTVSFDGSGSNDIDGTIIDHEWDIAGWSDYGETVTWTFTDAGVYIVDLYVFDNDGAGSDSASLTITVTAGNSAPVAEDQSVTVAQDASAEITLTATDADGDPLVYTIDTPPASGTLSGFDSVAGTVTYTPDAGFEGTDTFTFYASDGEYDSNLGTVSITVTSGSDFVCAIRASGGDYNSLSAWEAAIQSDLTSPASLVFSVTDSGDYDSVTDDGGTVTFTGGGTGTLVHVNVAGRAYVTDCAGVIEAGFVTSDVSGNAFAVSDTGQPIGSAIAECYNDWPNGLDDLLSISGWTTDPESWVIVKTPAGERHNGTLGNNGSYTGFTLASTTNDTAIYTNQRYSRIEGIAIDWSQASGEWADGIYLASGRGQDNADWIVDSCIVANIGHGFSGPAYAVNRPGTFVNCLAYNITKEGFCSSSFTYARFLNCTAVQCRYGFTAHSYSRSKPEWINCLAYNNAYQDFYGPIGGNPTADHCAGGDDTADSWGGEGNRIGQIFTFVDEFNDNFHLAADDIGAKDCGRDLSADVGYPFTADIDGDTRIDAWDIGADETAEGLLLGENPFSADGRDGTTDIPGESTGDLNDPEGADSTNGGGCFIGTTIR